MSQMIWANQISHTVLTVFQENSGWKSKLLSAVNYNLLFRCRGLIMCFTESCDLIIWSTTKAKQKITRTSKTQVIRLNNTSVNYQMGNHNKAAEWLIMAKPQQNCIIGWLSVDTRFSSSQLVGFVSCWSVWLKETRYRSEEW